MSFGGKRPGSRRHTRKMTKQDLKKQVSMYFYKQRVTNYRRQLNDFNYNAPAQSHTKKTFCDIYFSSISLRT